MALSDFFSLLGVGIIGAALAAVFRQCRPEFAMMVSLAAGVYILLRLLGVIGAVAEEVRAILSAASLPGEYAGILLKALGICFLTQIASDACKDAGESAISAKVELCGKLSVLAASLPLFRQVLEVAAGLIGV